MRTQNGGVNVGVMLFVAIGFVAWVLAVYVYVNRETNDFSEAKAIIADAAAEIEKLESAVKGLEDDTESSFAEVHSVLNKLTERVTVLEQKPLPAPPAPQPPPVLNFPKELTLKTHSPIAISLIERAGIAKSVAPISAKDAPRIEYKRKPALTQQKSRLKKVLKGGG